MISTLPSFRTFAIAAVLLVSATPVSAQIVNGGFETGDFTGWSQSGFINSLGGPTTGGPQYSTFLGAQAAGTPKAPTDGVITAQTTAFDGFGIAGPAIGPTSGAFLGFVANETSAGNSSITGTSISQTFTVPPGATQLTFSALLLNNDQTDAFVGFNDFGGVALTQGSTVLAQFNADLNPASAANIHVTAGTNQGGFRNTTPWTAGAFNVAGLVGQTVTLTVYATNYGGDNSVETRILVDNIQMNGSALVSGPVPAPTLSECMLVLLAGLIALTALGMLRRR
jgi:hypothetical protein